MQQLPDGWVPGEPWKRVRFRCMIVGEAPGKEEWKKKRPFVGSAGQFLRQELNAAGLDPDHVYITNVAKIWPRDANGKTRSPSTREIGAATPYLMEEIQHVAPTHILALGGTAYQTLAGSKRKIGLARGSWCSLDARLRSVASLLPTYHPSWIKHRPDGRDQVETWRRDLREFVVACSGEN